ncbi:hypothetical protein TGDOM2_251590 [Toxoplasma gondii GAB2-2007-GAL-DOM2]|uniref:Uncharacterized protein n=4 Tax=Toxoplasma gondii TaxID=5811 RepID=S7WG02_TOXGG|nr:hypothetical protein TGGT1_251590 [Toxoplasma gondii GT1]KFG40863.1 hypothetical protein TGDOM2_251590 [Toxoplasma gondii GAB2-2007-GAL-DOM2]KFG46458.1 hypothetical protein TGFOU_251590 [Toxoplasma gondii FOU]RQX70475.1 hypothetical protein TGCAST_251590 [Toxoplasma gondii CAST]
MEDDPPNSTVFALPSLPLSSSSPLSASVSSRWKTLPLLALLSLFSSVPLSAGALSLPPQLATHLARLLPLRNGFSASALSPTSCRASSSPMHYAFSSVGTEAGSRTEEKREEESEGMNLSASLSDVVVSPSVREFNILLSSLPSLSPLADSHESFSSSPLRGSVSASSSPASSCPSVSSSSSSSSPPCISSSRSRGVSSSQAVLCSSSPSPRPVLGKQTGSSRVYRHLPRVVDGGSLLRTSSRSSDSLPALRFSSLPQSSSAETRSDSEKERRFAAKAGTQASSLRQLAGRKRAETEATPNAVRPLSLENEADIQVVLSSRAVERLLAAPVEIGEQGDCSPASVALLYGVVDRDRDAEKERNGVRGKDGDTTRDAQHSEATDELKRAYRIYVEEVMVFTPSRRSGDGGLSRREKEEGIQNFLLGASPLRAAADRAARHLGLQLVGWASLRPPHLLESGDKRCAFETQRRPQPAGVGSVGPRRHFQRTAQKGREERTGQEQDAAEEAEQRRRVTPAEVLLSLHLHHHREQLRSEDPVPPCSVSSASSLSSSASSFSSSASSFSSSASSLSSSLPLVGLIVHRSLPSAASAPEAGRVEMEAVAVTAHGRDVWRAPVLPSLEEAFALSRARAHEGTGEGEDAGRPGDAGGCVAARHANSTEPRRSEPRARSATGALRRGRELKDFLSVSQKTKEDERAAGMVPLRQPVEIDGALYHTLPTEFFHRYLPVVAEEEEERSRAQAAGEEEEDWTEEVFHFSRIEGEPETHVNFQRRRRRSRDTPQASGSASPSFAELTDLLGKEGLPPGQLLQRLRRFDLLTQVAELLRNK